MSKACLTNEKNFHQQKDLCIWDFKADKSSFIHIQASCSVVGILPPPKL
jgi:hypothetical protein